MKDFFISLIIFACSLFIVLFFVGASVPTRTIVEIIALIIVLILLAINLFYKELVRAAIKRFVLFLVVLAVQLLVVSTGGLYSPFLILFHLLGLGISLLFSTSTSVMFVLFSFIILISGMVFDKTTLFQLYADPATAILYVISFLSIIPLAQLLVHKYKIKDNILTLLSNQIETEESIMAELNELVFVTGKEARILAINVAVEQVLHKTKEELLNQDLFSVLFLKDKDGKLINKNTLDLDLVLKEKKTKHISGISLLATSSLGNNSVSMSIKPITGLKGEVDQFSFIISGNAHVTADAHKDLEEASARHNAKTEEMKKRLVIKDQEEFYAFVLMTKAEQDILTARAIEDHSIEEKKIRVDVAALCKDAIISGKDFALAFHVLLQFDLPNFGKKDIEPMVTSLFQIIPERFTGPFFTAVCEARYLSIAIQKLLEVGVLLASSEKNPQVRLSVDRKNETEFEICVVASAPVVALEEQTDLLSMYYGALASKTNLNRGSGLEGYLAKKITDILNIPLKVDIDQSKNRVSFVLFIKKEKNKKSAFIS